MKNEENIKKWRKKTKLFPIFSAQFKPGENFKSRRKLIPEYKAKLTYSPSPHHHQNPVKGIKRIKRSKVRPNPTFRFKDLCDYFNTIHHHPTTTTTLNPHPPEDTQTCRKVKAAHQPKYLNLIVCSFSLLLFFVKFMVISKEHLLSVEFQGL